MSRFAVVTDTLSSQHFFPIWHKYYGQQFGEENLYVVTYSNSDEELKKFRVGDLIPIDSNYNNDVRAKFISSLVGDLLKKYDGVIRVDVDEIAVPDVRKFKDLRTFLEQCPEPYLTARGFDVIQTLSEPSIDWSQQILISQRRFAYPNSSLNKTFFTRIPLTWAIGFHASSAYPKFAEAFIFHLKRLDINNQLDWAAVLHRSLGEDVSQLNADRAAYYFPAQEQILRYHSDVSQRKVVDGWDGMYREAHQQKFLDSLQYADVDRCYHPEHFHEDVITKIPEEFLKIF